MDNQSATPLRNPAAMHFPVKIFLVVMAMSVLMIGVVEYSFHLGYKMTAGFSPLVDAAMEIQLEATTAHLWFEEITSGDSSEKIEDVMQHIDNAMWYATAMLEGGENTEGIFVPLANPVLRKAITEVLKSIKIFKEITKERYATIIVSGAGTPIEQKYDAIFGRFLEQAAFVETKLQDTIASGLERYRFLQLLLLSFLFSAMLFMLFTLYRYEKQRLKDLASIRDAHNEIKILSGFLPICASCKSIRDDNGSWNQLESYIKERSEVVFSHGICPDCAQKLYPEYAERIHNLYKSE